MKARVDELLEVATSISQGEVPEYQHNECFTAGAFDMLLVSARGADAFKLLQEVVERYDSVKMSEAGFRGYFYLLALLARQSDTTEMPLGIQAIIDEHPQFSIELHAWYRLTS